jgi:hypothetical protein
VRPLSRQGLRDGAADALGATRDNGLQACESQIHDVLLEIDDDAPRYAHPRGRWQPVRADRS